LAARLRHSPERRPEFCFQGDAGAVAGKGKAAFDQTAQDPTSVSQIEP
jgi:hypothetical protein